MFKKNEGILDRLIRVIIAELFLIISIFWIGGVVQIIFYVLSFVMLITSITGFCGLYKIFNIDTSKDSEKPKKVLISGFIILFLVFAIAGSYYSNFFTKKIFLEDFNVMNSYYKQTLFNTGQEKRAESITNYDKLVLEYADFYQKYSKYHPQVFSKDKNFNSDLSRVSGIIIGLKDKVYTGDLKESHINFEEVRPIFQDILKRNGFSMLAVYLVDFHDSMEKVIEAADKKNSADVIFTYTDANEKLIAVEEVVNDEEIKAIRKNLEELLSLAKSGNVENLSKKAAELKSSFVKVYLKRG